MTSSIRWEQLIRSSVELLEPFLDPALRDDPAGLAGAIRGPIETCGRIAESMGLSGLHQLTVDLLPALRTIGEAQHSDPAQTPWSEQCMHLEAWLGDFIAFCGGQLRDDEIEQLVQFDQGRSGASLMPAQDANELVLKLRADARVIAQLADGFDGDQTFHEVTLAQDEDPARPTSMTGEDELALIAEEVEALADRFLVLRREPGLPVGDAVGVTEAELPDREALLDLMQERLTAIVQACDLVGMGQLAEVLGYPHRSVLVWRQGTHQVDSDALVLLGELPRLLAAYLRKPEPAAAQALCRLLADSNWPDPLDAQEIAQLTASLGAVSLVRTRQVDASRPVLSAEDLSLQIPSDADPQTIEQILRELPALTGPFADHVARALQGSEADLDAARRIAHTLKGAANTVGVRAVATLTHLLEDVFHLLGESADAVPPELGELLLSAADCLGEMADAMVDGHTELQVDALQICNLLQRWHSQLLGDPSDTSVRSGLQAHHESIQTADSVAATGGDSPEAAPEASRSIEPASEASLRVSSELIDRMLHLSAEASALIAQAGEQLAELRTTRSALRQVSMRVRGLGADLDQQLELRSVTGMDRGDEEFGSISGRMAEAGADARMLGDDLERQTDSLAGLLARLERLESQMGEAALKARTLPVSSISNRLQRVVRQAARMAGRQVELEIDGEQIGVDAQLLQSLIEPLSHVLRNAVDHGIETNAQRVATGKSAQGRIRLQFQRSGRVFRIRCADDGQGLDLDAIRARGLESGLLEPHEAEDRQRVARLILQPGFSTRHQVSQLSGRGVGLEIANRAVVALRGQLLVESVQGQGTTFTFELPEQLTTVAVCIVRVEQSAFALSVRGIEALLGVEAIEHDAQGTACVWFDGQQLALQSLDERLGLPVGSAVDEPVASGNREQHERHVVILRLDDSTQTALLCPGLSQARDVIARPMPDWMQQIDGIEGATVLADGVVAPLLDLPRLLAGRPASSSGQSDPSGWAPAAEHASEQLRAPLCLVVDDSPSVRGTMERFLRDLGLDVISASDGVQALALVEQRLPAVAIVDLEMPVMNGIELASRLRSDERTHGIALVMITSRASDQHRAIALDAGVDAFLAKPFSEDELAVVLRRCLGVDPFVA